MGISLGAYRVAVAAALGHPPTDVLSNEEMDGAINDSYFEILRLFNHRRLKRNSTFSTVASQQEYALPADYWWMRILKDETNTQFLVHRSLRYIESVEDGSTGQPLYWTSEDQNLRLNPTPDGVYTVNRWYIARPGRLVQIYDDDLLGAEWEEIIKRGAESRAFYLMGEYDRQIHAKNLQRSLINTMVESQDMERVTGVDIVGPLEAAAEPVL